MCDNCVNPVGSSTNDAAALRAVRAAGESAVRVAVEELSH